MFVFKNLTTRTTIWRQLLFNYPNNPIRNQQNYSGLSISLQNKYLLSYAHRHTCITNHSFLYRKKCSKELFTDDQNELNVKHGKEIKKITDLFPEPRVVLNIFTTRTPSKVFDIYYKQNSTAPRGRKKGPQHNDWACTYAFVWPEKIKFEGTAISKRQAAENAATQAVHWLYTQRRIDDKGHPIYDKNVLKEVKTTLNEPILMSISDKSLERADKIWSEYHDGIKELYEDTFSKSKNRIIQSPAVLTKDSTIDEDDISDNEADLVDHDGASELKQHVHPVYGFKIMPPKPAAIDRRENTLRRMFQRYDEELTPLPIDEYSEQITSTIAKSRVTVIVGAAGCGKSTRTPAAILRHCGANTAAVVSEPRRVAAMGLAQRVASELGEEVGQTIGYQVRLHSKPPKPPCGSILYCTSGVLLRRLQTNSGLEGCSHVIIDEAHERDVNTDVTLLLLKRAMEVNSQLKIVIMSATLDTEVFTRYFDQCPVIEVPGRTFPVEVSYLHDIRNKFGINLPNTLENCQKEDGKPQVNCEEVAELIKSLDKNEKEGAILAFLPGWSEIKQTKQMLDAHYGESATHLILPVHSRLSTADQTKMFSIPAPGIRKIVLATNVAETSITIPDVVYVVDSGSHKETRIKEKTGIASLETVWVSMAGAKQRTGRAGRVQAGHCYRMYTKEKEKEFASHTTPEILRIPLEQIVLDCKSYAPNEKIGEFLLQLPEPPSTKAIQFAVNDLIEIGALTPQEQLTRLGGLLSSLTLHPRIGKSLLHSAIVGNIVAMSNVAAYCASNTEVFINAADRRDEIREIKRKFSTTSDHAALYGIQEQFVTSQQNGGREESDKFCDKYSLRGHRLAFINSISNLQLEQVLKSGMIPCTTEAEELNRFSDIEELTCGVLVSGTDSLLTSNKHVKTKGKIATVTELFTSTGDRAHIASESVNYNITKRSTKPQMLTYFGGHHSTERRALLVYKSSVIPPHTALLFCPGDVRKDVDKDKENTTVLELPKHRLKIHVPASQADHLLRVREMLWNTLKYYIERDLGVLSYDENTNVSQFKIRLIKLVGRIIVEGHREYVERKSGAIDFNELT